jgi:hypothetical protein
VDYYYVWPWPPVEILNEASPWQWLTPIGAFVGVVLLFFGGLIGVYLSNDAASKRQRQELDVIQTRHDTEMTTAQRRHEEQLAAMRAEGRAERAAQRNDRFREEVANLIGEKWKTVNIAYELAEAADQYFRD